MRTSSFVILAIALSSPVNACSRIGPVLPEEMVQRADLIVRATAVEYTIPPANPNLRTTGTPSSVVRFRVDEVVKGRHAPEWIDVVGYLSQRDDFNDRPAPYDFVRPEGRAGSCYANTYREGASFLLILTLRDNTYTPYWYALGPTNEQLHSPDDPWLVWVREQVAKKP